MENLTHRLVRTRNVSMAHPLFFLPVNHHQLMTTLSDFTTSGCPSPPCVSLEGPSLVLLNRLAITFERSCWLSLMPSYRWMNLRTQKNQAFSLLN